MILEMILVLSEQNADIKPKQKGCITTLSGLTDMAGKECAVSYYLLRRFSILQEEGC